MMRSLLRASLVVFPVAWLLASAVCPLEEVHGASPAASEPLTYAKDGSFPLPQNYREWVFLSSGIDMVYGPKGVGAPAHSMFDNVFVNPEAYRYFLANGTWPDGTVMVLEIRGAETHASINHGGHSQGSEVMGIEVHLKDASHFPEKWAFFDVNAGVGKLIPRPAACYTCHADHAAVDTTFAQFYPTLFPIAQNKGTLSQAYVKEFGAAEAAR